MGVMQQLQYFSRTRSKDGLYHVCNAVFTKSEFNRLIRYYNFMYPKYQISLIK